MGTKMEIHFSREIAIVKAINDEVYFSVMAYVSQEENHTFRRTSITKFSSPF